MNKILVPLDFSGASDWGFQYAYKIAEQFDAVLYVLHIYRPPYVDSTMPPSMIKQILVDKEAELLKHLKANAQAPLLSPTDATPQKVEIHYLLESGASSSIAEVAKKYDIDLIVMGTHGADNTANKIWGTNTARVIKEAKCPVLAIPAGAEFDNLRNIAYATDYNPEDIDNIMQLVLFATVTNARVHCIHINTLLDTPNEEYEKAFREKFELRFKDLPVSFSVRSSTSVEEGLETFLRINHISVLAMLTHKRGLWERIFGEKQMTREMVFRTAFPLLVFHS